MKTIIKYSFAIVAGLILGSGINMGIILISGSIIPPPEGADMTTMEGLKEAMHLMQPKHFLMPFLAHALGTFSGAMLAAFIAVNYKLKFALAIGLLFLIGGVINIMMLPSPTWFTFVDLMFAYIPMAWLGGITLLKLIQNET